MDIAEAVQKGAGIRRAVWPKDWCIKPTNSELGCVSFSKEKSAPRWEPTREDLVANDWEPINENGISANEQREKYGLSRIEKTSFDVKYISKEQYDRIHGQDL